MRTTPDQRILTILRCPICHGEMEQSKEGEGKGRSLFCLGGRRHCFDLSASGYVNLSLPKHGAGGDSKQAVRARTNFLNGGYYRPVRDALCDALGQYALPRDGVILDAGCGEGYYTAALAERGYSCIGLDLSKTAVDVAAKRMNALGGDGFFGVASVFEMPLADRSVQGIVNVFAPCAEQEYRRVLAPGGVLLVAYAGPDHLMGLKKALYEKTRENDGRADLPKDMRMVRQIRVRYDVEVHGSEAIQSLFAMTPYYWKTSVSDGEKLKHLSSLETTVDVIMDLYQEKATASDGAKEEG